MHVAVIGAGMMGAAAARHLGAMGHQVTLIGPAEPGSDPQDPGTTSPISSHYDAGRITRHLSPDPFWSRAATASIGRYRALERASGIPFFTASGAVMLGAGDSDFMRATDRTARDLNTPCQRLTADALSARLAPLRVPAGYAGMWEEDAGHIDPRALVAAQIRVAAAQGARVMRSRVTALRDTATGVTIATDHGPVTADHAVLAAGAMTDTLLDRPTGQWVLARTLVFWHLDRAEARRLAHLPSIVARLPVAGGPYLLPPIRYPDGSVRLKLGGDPRDVRLNTPAAMADHFASGGSALARDHLIAVMADLIPDLRATDVTMAPCVTTYTHSGRPTIARHSDRVTVLSAGNGAAAKSSDELGRLGALTALGQPVPDVLLPAQ